MLVFADVIGLLWLSTVPLTSGLVALMFGTRHVGMLFGVVFLSHQIGAFIGALLGGAIYDATGGYDVMWWLSRRARAVGGARPPADPRAQRAGARPGAGMSTPPQARAERRPW